MGIFAWWLGVVRFALLGKAPRAAREVPLWALSVPLRLWNKPVRHDGRTFADLHTLRMSKLSRALLPVRFLYLVYLFAWPLVVLTASIFRGRRYLRHAMKRPEMLAQYPKSDFEDRDIDWSRADYALAMYYGYRFHHRHRELGKDTFFDLDDKKAFLEACAKHGLPTPPTLAAKEAIAKGGKYIIKLPKSDLGFGVDEATAEELEADENPDRFVIQERLRNHGSLRQVFSNDAPLSSFRVLTLRTPEGPRVLRCAIRIGRAGSIVDNTQQGGIWAQVDSETGKILPGVTKKTYGKRQGGIPIRHGEHPDTKQSFVGLQIPYFEQCKELALRAQRELAPDAPSLGWDLALAESGPVFLEVNVWATCYDHDPPNDGFTPVCEAICADVARFEAERT
ncbi:MAG: sugar-transfer associated ATP-grasp domain-containing protein [Polyangiaceae bacterium]